MDDETRERLAIVVKYLGISILASGRQVEQNQLRIESTAWSLALERIPVRHLEECFKRAITGWTSEYMMPAAAVNKAYQDLLLELQTGAHMHSVAAERRLRSGQGSLGEMTLQEFKDRHNLPMEWTLGDPYPPESDLYQKRPPAHRRQDDGIYFTSEQIADLYDQNPHWWRGR